MISIIVLIYALFFHNSLLQKQKKYGKYMNMTMKAKIIFNPAANLGQAKHHRPSLEIALKEANIEYELLETLRPNHATEEARRASAEQFSVVVVVGGDGTVHEVINGLLSADLNHPLPLAIFPMGTGNDLSDMAKLPHQLPRFIEMLTDGRTRQIDIGRIEYDGNSRYFGNNCALAMEALITIETNALTNLRGKLRYLVGVIKGLRKLKPWQLDIEWNGGSQSGATYLLSICNTPRTGSSFLMSPNAKLDDGLFDVVLIPQIPMTLVLQLLPRFFNGSHLQHPLVHHFRTDTLQINSRPSTPIHADGEILTLAATQVEYGILPRRLTLITV